MEKILFMERVRAAAWAAWAARAGSAAAVAVAAAADLLTSHHPVMIFSRKTGLKKKIKTKDQIFFVRKN